MRRPVNTWRLTEHLRDSLVRSSGHILYIGNEYSAAIDLLSRSAENYNRKFYILTEGVTEVPKNSNFIQSIDDIDEISFIYVNDLPNNVWLRNSWHKLAYRSTVYVSEYNPKMGTHFNREVKSFLTKNKSEIVSARQMLLNGKREEHFVMKCFPSEKYIPPEKYRGKVAVATVLKMGGDYSVSYVNHIAKSISKNTNIDYKFYCLTDCNTGFVPEVNRVIPLKHGLEKWWSKIELFSSDIFEEERIFYLDLDTMIVKNIDEILQYNGNFLGLRDFYHQYGLGSGIMAWRNGDPLASRIYEIFMENPAYVMNNNRGGDQQFINGVMGNYIEYAQDAFPDRICSYKKDCVLDGKVTMPEKSEIICFHGKPRPHQVNDPQIKKYWYGG